MNHRANALGREIHLKPVPCFAEHWEDMKYVVSFAMFHRQTYQRIVYLLEIHFGYIPSPLVLSVQIFQFYIQYGGLNLVYPAVPAFIWENIFPR